MARRKGELPPGISRRHARGCPAHRGDDMEACRCRPSYQAQAGPRRARQTKTHATLAAAKAWKRDTDLAFEKGERTGDRAPVLRDAAETFLTAAGAGIVLARGDKHYRASTLRGYRRCMESELYPEFGDRPIDRITRKELNEFIMRLAARGLAASTIRNIVIPLRALYRHALDLEQVTANPTTGIRVPAGSGRRMRFLSPTEIVPTLEALDQADRAVWATAIYAGLRRGELMALRWSDVDLAAGMIRVELSYDPAEKKTGEVKSEAGQDRRVPICAALRDYLTEHRQRAGARPRGLVFARGSLPGRPVLAQDVDRPFSDQTLGQRANTRWNKAGLRPVTLHDCRHTFASLMIAATAASGTFNPKSIQQMLGHASIQQTYDRYGHLFPGAEEEAARMLDSFLEAGGGRSEVAVAVSRLLDAIEHADADTALPAVTEARDALESWLADQVCDTLGRTVSRAGLRASSERPAHGDQEGPVNSGIPDGLDLGGVPEWLNGAVSKTPRCRDTVRDTIRPDSSEKPAGAGDSADTGMDTGRGSRPPETGQGERASSPCPAHPTCGRGAGHDAAALRKVSQHAGSSWSRARAGVLGIPPNVTLRLVADRMRGPDEDMHGFEEREGALPTPPVEIAEPTRERLIRVVAAIVTGATPEEIAGYLEADFPPEVLALLGRPHEGEEMNAHVDLLLTTMQSPALAVA